MSDRIERSLLLHSTPEAVWEAITRSDWLADEVDLDLRPGGDATFRSGETVKSGWIEEASAPERLAFWWGVDGEPATRVELTIEEQGELTQLRVVETRPLELLDLLGTPLPGAGGRSYGPALVAA
jgi:uncharacterized protein YndB with AHSA1/START domain